MFTSITTKIHADLDKPITDEDFNLNIVIPRCLDALKETKEYSQLYDSYINIVDTYRFSGVNVWNTYEMSEFFNEDLISVLNKYAPEGYKFRNLPSNPAHYGYWKESDLMSCFISNNHNMKEKKMKYTYIIAK